MAQQSDDEYQGKGKTIELAAEDAARQVPKEIQEATFELRISARLSGEHNPIHGYIVQLSPGS